MLPTELEFPVRQEDVYNQHGSKIDGYKQLVHDTNNQLIAVHKDTYRVITHNDAYEMSYEFLQDNFNTNGMEEEHRHSNNGAVMATRFTLPEYVVPFRDTQISLEAVMWNSYNGMRSFKFDLGFYLWLCMNGLKNALWDLSLSSQHKGTRDIKLQIPNQYDAIDRLKTVKNSMENWIAEDVNYGEFSYEVDKLCLQPTRTDKSHVNQQHKRYIQDQYDQNYAKEFGENKFSAYQAITHWSTHYPSDSVNTRYDRERKVANCRWFH